MALGAAMALRAARGEVVEPHTLPLHRTPSTSRSPAGQGHTSAPRRGHGTRFPGGGDACHAGIERHTAVPSPFPSAPRALLDTPEHHGGTGVGARQDRAAGMGPPATPPGFIDGKLQESCPFNTDEAAVYASLCRLVPPAAYGRADFVLKLACVRGYHKEKPRAETTAAELTRILEWREKNRMDEVRGGQNTDRVAGGEEKGEAPAAPQSSLTCVGVSPTRRRGQLRMPACGGRYHGCVARRCCPPLRHQACLAPTRQCQLQPLTPALLPTTAAAAHAASRGRVPQVLAHAGARGGRLRALRRPRTDRGASSCVRNTLVTRHAPPRRCLTHMDVTH